MNNTKDETKLNVPDDQISQPSQTPPPISTAPHTPTDTSATISSTTATKPTDNKPHQKHIIFAITSAFVVIILTVGGILLTHHLSSNKDSLGTSTEDSSTQTPQTPQSPLPEITTPTISNSALIADDDKLALAFLKLHNDGKNSCYSPLSVRYALEMLQAGAAGDTHTQITQLLGNRPAKRYSNITDHLSLANSLWIHDGLQNAIRPDYINTLQDNFHADVKVDSFQSATNINNWLKDSTMGLIDKALNDSDVTGLTALLANALAIDMDWEMQFDELSTFGGYFNYHSDEDNQTTMMHQSFYTTADHNTSFYYSLAENATVLASDLKKYDDTQLQFIAIMPNSKTDLATFIKDVDNSTINTLISNLVMAKPTNNTYIYSFDAYIPKFKISEGGVENLVADLQQLGIEDAFSDEDADFSNLTDTKGFFIDSATHKTTFELNEKGIKAAAVTIAGGRGSSGGGPIPNSVHIVVSISRPFLYIVRDKDSGDVWFTGTVYQGNRWDDDKSAYGRQ